MILLFGALVTLYFHLGEKTCEGSFFSLKWRKLLVASHLYIPLAVGGVQILLR